MTSCNNCIYQHTFVPRQDEKDRYVFADIGYGCKHPVDGGHYILDPSKPDCLKGPIVSNQTEE